MIKFQDINKFIFMNIRLSKQSKKLQTEETPNPECNLFNFRVLSETVIFGRRSFSRRKSKMESKSGSKGALKLLKHHEAAEESTKSNSIQSACKMEQASPMELRKVEVKDFKKQDHHHSSNRLAVPNTRSNASELFHGSWGIPKYGKCPEPPKEIKVIPEPQFYNTKYNISTFNLPCPKSQSSPFQKKQISMKTSQNESWKVSKFMNSTNASKNEEANWGSSMKLAESHCPLVTSSQSVTLSPNFPQTSRTTNNYLKPICNLEDAREVNTVFSGDVSHVYSRHSHTHSREFSDIKTNKSIKNLNESLVIGNDMNQDGFWN